MTGREALIRRLRLLRRRMLVIGGMSGLCLAIAACLALWFALIWLDLLWELSPDERIFTNIAAITVGAVLLSIILIRWYRLSQDALLARQLDRAGGSGGQVIAGYELSAESATSAQSSELSAGLAALAVNRAVALAREVPPAQVVRGQVLRAPVVALATLILVLAAMGTLMPRLAETEWLRFIDPRGDHPPYSRVTFIVTPGDAKVLYASGLDVFVTTEGPRVEQVELILAGAEDDHTEALGMFPQQDSTWRAVLTNITTPCEYFVRAGRSRSARYALEVITVPTLETVRFRVTPPAYTRHAAYEGALPQAGLVGLPGTEVYVWAKSNRPLSGGILKITGSELPVTVPLAPQSPGEQEVSGSFKLSTPGKFEVAVQDVSGVFSKDTFSDGITLVSDQRPLVRVIEPAATSLATPEATLPVVLSGEDDYGISRLQLFRSLNDSRALPMDFVVPQPADPRFAPTQALPLSAYGLNAGDVIKLYARIEDNDPAGAKGSESPVCEVRIISQDEFNRMIRAREGLEVLLSKYRQAERRLESLADEREGLRKKLEADPANDLSQAARDGLARLARQLRSDAEANREALRHLLPYDLDAALAERLAKLAEALDTEAQAAEDLANSGNLTREQLKKLLDDMAHRLDAEREEFADETLEPLEHLEAIFPLIEDQSRFVELYQLQRDLSQRLASVKGRDGEDDPRLKGRMRDFETEQQRIRIALDQLLGDIESHASRLPDDDERLDELRASALRFADAVRASGASEAMAEAGLTEFSGTRAHAAATQAADILEQFIDQSQGIGGKGRASLAFQPQLGAGLGNTVDQLLAELGLSSGDGPGSGSGGGNSARRSTLSNVGLYGRLPGVGEVARSGASRGPTGVGANTGGGPTGREDPALLIDAQRDLRASGASGASIPAAYRHRVGAYFQRLVEDNGSR